MIVPRNLAFLLVALVLVGCETTTTEDSAPSSTIAGTVQLSIAFHSDRKDIHVDVPCSADSTVFTILQRAQNIGDLKFRSTGSDDMVFVNSIGGVENLGGNGDNWIYRVNGELASKSCGIFDVSPGDEVEWSFGKYEPEE